MHIIRLNQTASLAWICWWILFLSHIPLPTGAATPSQSWYSHHSDNFIVHYPDGYQSWAHNAARELEGIKSLVETQLHRQISKKIDVVVYDPLNAANGSALPLRSKPLIRLYTTTPSSDSFIGNFNSWSQLLLLHEYIHVLHLAQPSRNHWANLISQWWDLFDAANIPGERWVAEGYATLHESRLTGRGRLYAQNAQAFVSQLLREGAMPDYRELNATDGRYLAGTLAYLVGSRYLAWLEKKFGPQQLDAVWTRWKALKRRSFRQAFKGVYGQLPDKLYRRFVAEQTYQQLASDAQHRIDHEPAENSRLWLDLEFHQQDPAVSPDGKKLVLTEINKDRETSLVIYSTDENDKKRQRFNQQQKIQMAADPADISDKSPPVFNREELHRLSSRDFTAMRNPRWLPGTDERLLFSARIADANRDQHHEIFVWDLHTQQITRLTHDANIRRFDLLNDGVSLIGEQNRYGRSQLVTLNLDTQVISPVTLRPALQEDTPIQPASSGILFDFPRISADQQHLAYLIHQTNHHWQIRLHQRNNDAVNDTIVPLPQGYQFVSYPHWHHRLPRLYFIASVENHLGLYQYDLPEDKLSRVSQPNRPIAWPFTLGDNTLLYLSQDSEGVDVVALNQPPASRALTLVTRDAKASPVPGIATQIAELATAHLHTQHPPNSAPSNTNSAVINATHQVSLPPSPQKQTPGDTIKDPPYGSGHTRPTFTLAASYNQAAASELLELGIKGADTLQRLNWHLNISQDIDNNLHGYSGAVQWQGWPVTLNLSAFDLTMSGEHDYQGQRLMASWDWRQPAFTVGVNGSYQSGDHDNQLEQHWELGIRHDWQIRRHQLDWRQSASLHWLDGRSHQSSWRGVDGHVAVKIELFDIQWSMDTRWHKRFDHPLPLLTLGGYPSTLLQPEHHPHLLLEPALPFSIASTSAYRQYELGVPLGEMVRLFYRHHELRHQHDYRLFGLAAQREFDFGFTGVNQLRLDLGVAYVEQRGRSPSKRQEPDPLDTTRIWAGIWYDW